MSSKWGEIWPRLPANVLSAQVADRAPTLKETVLRVHVDHVGERTEPTVFLNPWCAVHEVGSALHESPDLCGAALSSAWCAEVLASELRDPDVATEAVMIVRDVVDEVAELQAVPMRSHGADCAVVACVHEGGQPLGARLCVRRRGGNEPVALAGKGRNMLFPELGSIVRVYVRLSGMIGLIEAKHMFGETGLEVGLDAPDRAGIVDHGDEFNVVAPLHGRRLVNTPRVHGGDLSSHELGELVGIFVVPCDASFTATTTGWRGTGRWGVSLGGLVLSGSIGLLRRS